MKYNMTKEDVAFELNISVPLLMDKFYIELPNNGLEGGEIRFNKQGVEDYMKDKGRKEVKETVNHPKHYNMGKIEVIDAIDDWDLDFCAGNVIKYVVRAEHKGGREDLEKALWYIQRMLKK